MNRFPFPPFKSTPRYMGRENRYRKRVLGNIADSSLLRLVRVHPIRSCLCTHCISPHCALDHAIWSKEASLQENLGDGGSQVDSVSIHKRRSDSCGDFKFVSYDAVAVILAVDFFQRGRNG